MSQNCVESLPRFLGYDVLVLNTSNDFDGPAAATADLNIDVEHTRLSRCAQVIAPCRSALRTDGDPIGDGWRPAGTTPPVTAICREDRSATRRSRSACNCPAVL